MPDIKLTDGSLISFKKSKKKKRYEICIQIQQSDGQKKITLHVDRNVLNLLQFEIDDLLGG